MYLDPTTQAIFQRCSNDATLAALIAKRKDNTSIPAVYMDDVPTDAPGPYVECYMVGGRPFDSKTTVGARCAFDLNCFTPRKQSITPCVQAADRLYNLFHRAPLTVAGFSCMVAKCSGPFDIRSGEHYHGRGLTVEFLLERT